MLKCSKLFIKVFRLFFELRVVVVVCSSLLLGQRQLVLGEVLVLLLAQERLPPGEELPEHLATSCWRQRGGASSLELLEKKKNDGASERIRST